VLAHWPCACCRLRASVVVFQLPEDHRPATLSFVARFALLPPAANTE